MAVSELILRLFIAFFVLFLLTRIMGRKEISQMTFFNFVSAIAIGSITASLAVSESLSIRNGIIALVGWAAFTLIMAFVDIKSKNLRKYTTGEPIIVIKDGKIMEQALRKTQLDMDSLNSMLREKDVFSLNDVDYAVFETSGKLSVMKKENKLPVTRGDLRMQNQYKVYPAATEVISDGVVNTNNLSRLQLDKTWLEQQLKNVGINSIEEVFFAEVQPDGSLYIDSKDDQMKN
ncbi:DUF421 domain-containing protein [Ureibacillus aquaedulcis]|uniref:DUF421 domain-containing protein n=1 Tax=Ureibacillus aquaedulcis TaxID=3058421 RepID=A0ABT8GM32_9BACL|nr:DUF421 domain-containing protein [Ureibacillus sp. BA0131]MDN4492485.1 DUF421 domain-containing protein [Ureibacillus sp. BA0131]